MPEMIHKINVFELKTIRITCNKEGCGGAVEVPLAGIARPRHDLKCPSCDEQIRKADSSSGDAFSVLGEALTKFLEALNHKERMDGKFKVEFVFDEKANPN